MKYTYNYPRPAVTVDSIIFRFNKANKSIEVLLIQRKAAPYKGQWAFPGGFANENEDLVCAATRELKEETGLTKVQLLSLPPVGTPGRDPRGHVITCPFVGTTKSKKKLSAKDDAKALAWWNIEKLPKLAFDHKEIINSAFLAVTQTMIEGMITKEKGAFNDILAQRSFSLAFLNNTRSKTIKQ